MLSVCRKSMIYLAFYNFVYFNVPIFIVGDYTLNILLICFRLILACFPSHQKLLLHFLAYILSISTYLICNRGCKQVLKRIHICTKNNHICTNHFHFKNIVVKSK